MSSPHLKCWLCLAFLAMTCSFGVLGFSSLPSPSAATATTAATALLFRSTVNVALYAKKPLPFRATTSLSSPDIRATRSLYKPKPPEADRDNLAQLDKEHELMLLEREIQESTKAQLDLRRVAEILEDDGSSNANAPVDSWQVSLAAGSVAGAVTLGVTDSWILAVIALSGTFVVAGGDPLEEQTPAGATARVVGRATLSSLQMLQPKFRAIARVAFKGASEEALLKQRLADLELENANLRLWQKRRNVVDDSVSKYTVTELKQKAREHKLPVGGSKTELLMRLVEAEVIQIK